MEQSPQNPSPKVPQPSEPFGNLPNTSEPFGTIRKPSESFGNVRNPSEAFRNVPNPSEQNEYCTLTVREVSRMFEAAGVARTERSIINWCQLNKMGVARLDNYFDPNERKYFISPQSAELVIEEEKAKAVKTANPLEPAGTVRNDSERPAASNPESVEPSGKSADLEKELLDLKILNSGKDFLIQQLRQERDGFFDKLLDASRKVGELETKLLRLEEPKPERG
jgi:hypothetical protein